jgi:hypothetical protein
MDEITWLNDEHTGEAGQSSARFCVRQIVYKCFYHTTASPPCSLLHNQMPLTTCRNHIPFYNAYGAHIHCDMRKCIPPPHSNDLVLSSVCSCDISGHTASLLCNTVHVRWVMSGECPDCFLPNRHSSYHLMLYSLDIALLWHYSPLWTLASLITMFWLSLSCTFFHQAVTIKVSRYCSTSPSHLNFGPPFFLLPSS